ncbi:putative LPS assembly protein LptD [Adhaeribacter pallidiroseus]|uniref:LPS-assembly protein LptD central domain-containing protein n=1 Tax=Adhaeribacter pallidiroseus TaxID=2072847 RepID=A0A369QG00_9BACT|nr:putative LPS assembly protein LptD [Adhaeribacter pallidiroseus]RDC63843.1 hypothetical protein AHMF7616_02452 [Adhaeribacter pallidiroseus]
MRIFLAIVFALSGVINAWAQQTPNRTTTPQTPEILVDTAKVKQDSIQGDITTTIKYTAKDSIVLNVQNRLVNMYNDASIDYGTMSLKAHTTQLDYKTNLVNAIGSKDSTGKALGTPLFKDDQQTYEAEQISYNFKTKKGKIREVVTKQGEGFLHAEVVKKTEGDAMYGIHSKYTTCDLPHPHFYINSSKMKAIPGKKIFTGPFNLVFGDIPTPLGFLFGYFPTPKKRSSGLIIPTFGESRQRGFYLRNGGYYFVLNENIDMRLTGDIYSLGSYGLQLQSMYIKRYRYRGNISMSYSSNKTPVTSASEATIGPGNFNRIEPKSFWISASHTPTTLRPGGKWSASVNAGTQFYNRQNRFDSPALALNNTFNSSVQYQFAKPTSPFTLTASALHNMNTTTGVHNFTLPEATFAVNRQTPLKWFQKKSSGSWFEDIALSYNVSARNLISTQINSSTLSGVPNLVGGSAVDTVLKLNGKNFRRILANADYGIQHSLPITMNSIRLFKFFQLSPGLSYNETWFFKKFDYNYLNNLNAVRIDTTNGFYRAYTYAANASLSTRVYGTYIIKGKKIEAIRHLMTPNISYSYNPDFSKKYTRQVQVGRRDIEDNIPIQYLPIYRSLYGVPTSFRQSNMNFSLTNNVEMKVRAKSDTASTFEKVSLIDNLGITSGYNFAADSFQLQNFNIQFRTLLFKKLNLFSNAVFDPYKITKEGRRLNEYSLSSGQLARLVNANLNMSMELNPEALKKGSQTAQEQAPRTNRPSLETNQNLVAEYVDFKIPWTLSLNFTASYFKSTSLRAEDQISKSLGVDGSVNLTEKWKVTYSTGYDFQFKQMTYTSLNIYRDLHCWEMSISWVPFGEYQSYSININARSSILRDLKLSRNRGINWR